MCALFRVFQLNSAASTLLQLQTASEAHTFLPTCACCMDAVAELSRIQEKSSLHMRGLSMGIMHVPYATSSHTTCLL